MKVFIDANVLFSAALGGEAFRLIWAIADSGRIALCTSKLCITEARINLERKRKHALPELEHQLESVEVVREAPELEVALADALPEKDRPVLAAAIAAEARVLITGDVSHFGALMDRDDLPLRVCTPRAFLLEGT